MILNLYSKQQSRINTYTYVLQHQRNGKLIVYSKVTKINIIVLIRDKFIV